MERYTRFKKFSLLLCLALLGCGKAPGGLKGLSGGHKVDFLKTQLIAGAPVAADGVSQLLVGVQLKNSDNSPVSDYLPAYSISSGSGVIKSTCTNSDANGVSACILKSTVPGIKTMQLTNGLVGLSQHVQFIEPAGFQRMSLVPSSQVRGTTPQGSVAQITLGNQFQGNSLKTAGGYQVKLSVQGLVNK